MLQVVANAESFGSRVICRKSKAGLRHCLPGNWLPVAGFAVENYVKPVNPVNAERTLPGES